MKLTFSKPSAVAILGILSLSPLCAMASAAATVGIKCEIVLTTRESSNDQRMVRSMKPKTESGHSGVMYSFDHIETLKTRGKPDLKVWIEGHYFHNNNKDNSFMRFAVTACGNKPNTAELECFGQVHSGDVFSNIVRAKTIHQGKNLLMHKNALPAADLSKSFEAQMKYRLITGRSLLKDLDTYDPIQREKYLSLLTPVLGVECSVRDDDYGVVSAF